MWAIMTFKLMVNMLVATQIDAFLMEESVPQ